MFDRIQQEIDEQARIQIIQQILRWKISSYLELPSEWAQENRYLPQGVSNKPGKINHDIAPHMVEICDNFHPDSGIVSTSIMKSTQSLATTTIEHVIGWAIKNKLHNILYIISSKSMAKMRSSAAIDVLIDYSGLADYVKPISTRMKHKTADNTFYKELVGGYRLMLTSWNSIADAKSFSWDLLIFDEIDEAPFELKGQGDPEKLFEVRGITARHLKIAKLSTPTTTAGRIYRNFKEGDQRYYFMPCPLCGEMQILTLMGLPGVDGYGLTARSEKVHGVEQIIPDTVEYICEHCRKSIQEYHKQDMLSLGKWYPTARPISPQFRSYHITNLMSPIVFFSWDRVMQMYLETEWGQRISAYKSFLINIMGKPWETKVEKKDYREIMNVAEEYQLGEMPAGALVPVAGFDVQKRWIEGVVVGYGRNMEAWIIDHVKFHAQESTKDKNDRCWKDWQNYVLTKRFKFKSTTLPIAINAIDSGYNPEGNRETDVTQEHTVYDMVARTPRCVACRGNPKLKDAFVREERVKKKSALKRRFDIATNDIKDEIFIKLDLPSGAPGAIHFSKQLSEDFFKGFLSEVFKEIEPGKWGYEKIFERNEPLDCFCETRAGAEILNLPAYTEEMWNEYEKRIIG